MKKALDINVDANYGLLPSALASTLVLVSSRGAKYRQAHSILSVVAKVALEFEQIDDPALTVHASASADNPAAFLNRFGKLVVRGLV